MLRLLVLLCALAGAAAFAPAAHTSRCVGRSAVRPLAVEMAHHVNKKATKKHTDRRPKKHSLADKNRKPPPYAVDPMSLVKDTPDFTIVGQ